MSGSRPRQKKSPVIWREASGSCGSVVLITFSASNYAHFLGRRRCSLNMGMTCKDISAFCHIAIRDSAFCAPCARCVTIVVHDQEAVSRHSPRFVQTRPSYPTQEQKWLNTDTTVTGKHIGPKRQEQFCSRPGGKKGSAAEKDETISQLRFLYFDDDLPPSLWWCPCESAKFLRF
ncbi:hypothetical protein EI94DRAFT_276970 [Lactarius quietus]|nr:hypothetical protein EI94DRAFT_276970 [Lactarius quietus]